MTEVKTALDKIRARMVVDLGNLIPGLRDEAAFLTDALIQRSDIPLLAKQNDDLRRELAEVKMAAREAAALLSGIRP